jgi:hypothetical protein
LALSPPTRRPSWPITALGSLALCVAVSPAALGQDGSASPAVSRSPTASPAAPSGSPHLAQAPAAYDWTRVEPFGEQNDNLLVEGKALSTLGEVVLVAAHYAAEDGRPVVDESLGGRSEDGATWSRSRIGKREGLPPTPAIVRDVIAEDAGFLAVGTGVWRAGSGEDRWRPVKVGRKNQGGMMEALVALPDGGLLVGGSMFAPDEATGGFVATATLWRSPDGRKWSHEVVGTSAGSVAALALAPDGTLLRIDAGRSDEPHQAWVGDGSSWQPAADLPLGDPPGHARAMGYAAGRFWLSVVHGFGKDARVELWTTADGSAWEPGPPLAGAMAIAETPAGEVLLVAALEPGGPALVRSSADWSTWAETPGPEGGRPVSALSLPDGDLLVITYVAGETDLEWTTEGWLGTPRP